VTTMDRLTGQKKSYGKVVPPRAVKNKEEKKGNDRQSCAKFSRQRGQSKGINRNYP